MRQLHVGMLAGIFVVAGVLAWAGSRLWNSVGTLPSVPVAAPVVLALIATILTATALSLRARLGAQREREPHAKGVDPLMAARWSWSARRPGPGQRAANSRASGRKSGSSSAGGCQPWSR